LGRIGQGYLHGRVGQLNAAMLAERFQDADRQGVFGAATLAHFAQVAERQANPILYDTHVNKRRQDAVMYEKFPRHLADFFGHLAFDNGG